MTSQSPNGSENQTETATPEPNDSTQKESEGKPRETEAVRNITWLMAGGLAVVIVFSLPSGGTMEVVRISATGVLVAVASALVGALIGFLFGVPRAPRLPNGAQQAKSAGLGMEGEAPNVGNRGSRYLPNTNLEQISDWLTKILVGAGVTQINALPRQLRSLADFIGPGLGATPTASVFAGSIVVFYVVAGFLEGYLWTRLTLGKELQKAETVV